MRIGVVHHRHDEVLGDVHELEHVDAGVDAHAVAAPRRTPRAACCRRRRRGRPPSRRCARRPPRSRPANWRCPSPGCDGRGSRSRSQAESCSRSSADPRRDVVGQHVAGGVGAVDAVGAVALHQLRLRQELLAARPCAPSSGSPTVSRPSLRDKRDVLLGDVGLGAVRGDADGGDAAVLRHVQVVDRADAGQQQRRDLRACFSLRDDARAGTPRRCARGSRS